jgi:hypothetical protein
MILFLVVLFAGISLGAFLCLVVDLSTTDPDEARRGPDARRSESPSAAERPPAPLVPPDQAGPRPPVMPTEPPLARR